MKKISSDKRILVLGAKGLIGSSLFSLLQRQGLTVAGTTRVQDSDTSGLVYFDGDKEGAVESFPWESYDVIVDCMGIIDYEKTPISVQRNSRGNVELPLAIIRQLKEAQQYFYCSTHAVLLPPEEQNPYVSSKIKFEQEIETDKNIRSTVTILRVPAVFSEVRRNGLLNTIKQHFSNKETLEFRFQSRCWHTMYLERLSSVMSDIILANPKEGIVTIGYPTETSIEKILKCAEAAFGNAIPVVFAGNESDHYVPDVRVQSAYSTVSAGDFERDLEEYFKK